MKRFDASQILALAAGLAVIALLGACAKPIPYQQPVAVTPPSGRVAISETVTVFDVSGSKGELFPESKATLESLVAAMPDGRYEATQVHFGGRQRAIVGGGGFDRSTHASAAKEATFFQGSTPLYSVLENEVADALGDGSGKAAVVVLSDGLATDYQGRDDDSGRALAAARSLAENRAGKLCFHTIQTGSSPEGATLLRSLADTTSCGSFTTAASLGSASALQRFSRNVYLGGQPAPPPKQTPVASTAVDSDGDGVIDPRDKCPGTLRQARVDARGCWSLKDLRFAVNGAAIEAGFEQSLNADIAVLKANPKVRIRVDGHTDSDGPAAYNQALSERRAASVRDYLVSRGLDADRFEVKGFGESKPIVANDSAANKRRNRRVELTIID